MHVGDQVGGGRPPALAPAGLPSSLAVAERRGCGAAGRGLAALVVRGTARPGARRGDRRDRARRPAVLRRHMTSGCWLLALWLMPAAWLEVTARLLEAGAQGLWLGLAFTLAPLLALSLRSAGRRERPPGALFARLALMLVIGVLLWAQLVLAADVASTFGIERGRAIALTAGAGWLVTVVRARRLIPVLLVVVIVAATLPLLEFVRLSRVGPLGAWDRVASQSAFTLPATSPWVTVGHDLGARRPAAAILFEQEHRVTAPAGGRLRVRAQD